ncbi:MAG TPA: hypothetical protein PLJ65_13545, partial [Casimicrobium sp.]|nr:hypothetical protein [Casimicrobium sp.]
LPIKIVARKIRGGTQVLGPQKSGHQPHKSRLAALSEPTSSNPTIAPEAGASRVREGWRARQESNL